MRARVCVCFTCRRMQPYIYETRVKKRRLRRFRERALRVLHTHTRSFSDDDASARVSLKIDAVPVTRLRLRCRKRKKRNQLYNTLVRQRSRQRCRPDDSFNLFSVRPVRQFNFALREGVVPQNPSTKRCILFFVP